MAKPITLLLFFVLLGAATLTQAISRDEQPKTGKVYWIGGADGLYIVSVEVTGGHLVDAVLPQDGNFKIGDNVQIIKENEDAAEISRL
ncbi:hypothetical protein [Beggiatoa leptomitoformis]|uniref:Uncharacterized protein n=1 Tax=Beggiatoa leptomitoformis TaxID=288004 RepID=A0A2N9YEZ7_9GAMM|nr:hypothetical protein [Beggiatoa leptomitoformis]ALG68653.1 hypothetical protein AL038_14275 [Beggiatoa leptomitoformis]AUI68995.1 hypothetical protein BLE401_09985 [Beggiatoa leptomitoformis]